MVGAELHRGVDGGDGADAFVEGVDRLVDHRHEHAVDDEGGEILGVGGGFAERLGKGDGGVVGRRIGGDAPDDLHEIHQRHRVHEVQADESLRAIRGRRQPGDRDRGGVRREQGVGAEIRREAGEDGLLDRLVLGRRLDRQVGGADFRQACPDPDAGQSSRHSIVLDDAPGDLPGHVAAD